MRTWCEVRNVANQKSLDTGHIDDPE